jgi:hypothetical protein
MAAMALLASAVLGLGQMNGMQASAGPMQNSRTTTNTAAPARPAELSATGAVNYMEGEVLLDNQPLGAGSPVIVQPGQTLATGNGYAEVLLTPGAFLRVGHDSQVRLITSGLVDTKAQLDRGTAIVEVDQLIKGTNLTVVINGATAQIEKKGLYDFDADQQAVKVLDGKAKVIEVAGTKTIGKGNQILLAGAEPLKKSDFDVKAVKTQPLYVWSEARSQDESQSNIAVAQNVAAYGGFYGSGWYWDPYWSSYAYLPGDGFLYSPFGWGFYSPGFIGYYGVPFGYYGHFGRYGGRYGRVGGTNARVGGFHGGAYHGGVAAGVHSGFAGGGGFHGGGGGGGFHGGGGGGGRR